MVDTLWNTFKVQYAAGHDLHEQVPLGKVLEDYARWLEKIIEAERSKTMASKRRVRTAGLKLCMELFKLSGGRESGWNDTVLAWTSINIQSAWVGELPEDFTYLHYPLITPAYDLSYLLRKLPQNSWVGYTDTSGERGSALAKTYAWDEKGSGIDKIAECVALTLEDVACKLAIELLRQGILK